MGFKDLYSALNSELPIVKDNFPEINYGGCGVFALFLSKELDKLGIEHSITWIGQYEGYDSDYNTHDLIHSIFDDNGSKTNVCDFHNNDLTLSHIMVVIDGYLVDATGVYLDLDDADWGNREELAIITQKQLELLVSKPDGWNDWFDRDNIPNVGKMVKKIMKKVAKGLEI